MGRTWMRLNIYMGIFFILFSISLFTPTVTSNSDAVFFFSYGTIAGDYIEENTDYALIGENIIYLRIIFPQNVTEWTIDMLENPLVERGPSGKTVEKVSAGHINDFGIPLNLSALPGIYNITIFFNYTNESGEIISDRYDYQFNYLKSLEIKEIVSANDTATISIEIETYVHLEDFTISLVSVGDISIIDEEHHFQNISPDTFKITSRVDRHKSRIQGNQSISWRIIAMSGTHRIELLGQSEVYVDWDVEPQEPDDSNIFYYSFGIIIILIIPLILMRNYVLPRKK